MNSLQEIFDYKLFSIDDINVTIGTLAMILVAYLVTRLVLVVSRKTMNRYFARKKIDIGRSYTINQFVKYLIYIVFFVSILNIIGLKLNYVLAGSAALLVGVGIGLQSTFNDFFCGLVLLYESSVSVGDQLLFPDDIYGTVKKIGMRSSKIETRDRFILIIPNSKLVNDQVVNLSNSKGPVRFHIDFGVSYKNDIKLAEKLILEVMDRLYPTLPKRFKPVVHLHDFGSSSIDLKLYFYSKEVMNIEKYKSEIRKLVYDSFNEHHIEIPFPQQDVYIKELGNNKVINS